MIRHAGLAPRSAWVLRILEQADEPLTAADIGKRAPMWGCTIRAALKSLTAARLVHRRAYVLPDGAKGDPPPATYTAIPQLAAVSEAA